MLNAETVLTHWSRGLRSRDIVKMLGGSPRQVREIVSNARRFGDWRAVPGKAGRPATLDRNGIIERWNRGDRTRDIAAWAGTSDATVRAVVQVARSAGAKVVRRHA